MSFFTLPNATIGVAFLQQKQIPAIAITYWDFAFQTKFKPFLDALVVHLQSYCNCIDATLKNNNFKSSFWALLTWQNLPPQSHKKLPSRKLKPDSVVQPVDKLVKVTKQNVTSVPFLQPLVWEPAWDSSSFFPTTGPFKSNKDKFTCLARNYFQQRGEDAPPFIACLARLVTPKNGHAIQVHYILNTVSIHESHWYFTILLLCP